MVITTMKTYIKSFRSFYYKSCYFRAMSTRNNIDNAIENGTVNMEEMDKFRRMSSIWWDEDGQLKALHAMNLLRVALICDGLKWSGVISSEIREGPLPLKGIQILDVGCGGGILTEALATLGASTTGLDPCEDVINIAISHSSQNPIIKNNINYICGSIEDIVMKNIKYDAIVASEVVEHVDNLNQFISCCVKLVKDRGSLFYTTVNRTWSSYIFGIIAAEWILRIVRRGTHQWNKFINPLELQESLENNGCRVRLVHGMRYRPAHRDWRWSGRPTVNYALHALKP